MEDKSALVILGVGAVVVGGIFLLPKLFKPRRGVCEADYDGDGYIGEADRVQAILDYLDYGKYSRSFVERVITCCDSGLPCSEC